MGDKRMEKLSLPALTLTLSDLHVYKHRGKLYAFSHFGEDEKRFAKHLK